MIRKTLFKIPVKIKLYKLHTDLGFNMEAREYAQFTSVPNSDQLTDQHDTGEALHPRAEHTQISPPPEILRNNYIPEKCLQPKLFRGFIPYKKVLKQQFFRNHLLREFLRGFNIIIHVVIHSHRPYAQTGSKNFITSFQVSSNTKNLFPNVRTHPRIDFPPLYKYLQLCFLIAFRKDFSSVMEC